MIQFQLKNQSKKTLLTMLSLAFFLFSNAQTTVVFADPAVGSFDLTNMADVSVPDANSLYTSTVYKLKLTLVNLDQLRAIPAGTCAIRIGLGSRVMLDPNFNLSTAPYNNYFAWTSTTSGSQVQITGTIITPLPPDFLADLSFNVISKLPTTTGTSSFSANFLITNDNPLYLFSDLNPNNNTALLSYTFTFFGPLPVNITNFNARNKDCNIDINWNVSQQINLTHYAVEVSKDGISFTTLMNVNATNRTNYNATIPLTEPLKAPVLFIRLKSVEADGTFKYSSILTVKGNCLATPKQIISCYPNPVTNENYVTIAAKGETFNGVYLVSLLDAAGKTYFIRKETLLNVTNFKLDLNARLASGKYFIILQREDDVTTTTLPFIKE
ncbi:MAG: discoidin domain-containing protein [Ferruginibacter sp.]|nr:discoidin domain-containing protein [Ferruginibacter sp.]